MKADFQEMFAAMYTELLRNVSELRTFFFKTNDAGSGICWADWLYTGPNGPVHCENISTGERIASLLKFFKNGAESVNRNVTMFIAESMFSDEEKVDIYNHLPEGCYFQSHNSEEVKSIASKIISEYPVRGLFEPVEIIRNMRIPFYWDLI